MRFGIRPRLIFLVVACFVLVGSGNASDSNPHPKAATLAASLGRESDLKAGHQVTLKGESLQDTEHTEVAQRTTEVRALPSQRVKI